MIMFEKSKWISLKTKDRDISVLFRKEFCVDKNLKSAELKITYPDGTEILINTDSLWKTSPGGCVYNHMRQGEIYDFNLTQKGFDKKGFDDSAWMDVELHRNLEG